jgi:hypothetical protein
MSVIVGAGLGAAGAVGVWHLDPTGDTLKIYLGAMTVLMGSALGLGASRLMDSAMDRRKVTRKLNLALIAIRHMIDELTSLAKEVAELRDAINAQPTTIWKEMSTLTQFKFQSVGRSLSEIALMAEERPDFDELIDTFWDAEYVARARDAFRKVRQLAQGPIGSEDERMVHIQVIATVIRDTFESVIRDLEEVEQHFAKRVPDLLPWIKLRSDVNDSVFGAPGHR